MPKLITNPERIKALLAYKAMLAASNDAEFSDLGQSTGYRMEISLPRETTDEEAERICSLMGDVIAPWLVECNKNYELNHGMTHPRLLSGEFRETCTTLSQRLRHENALERAADLVEATALCDSPRTR